MKKYAKLIYNNLIIAGNIISGKDNNGRYTITNPSEQQLLEKGYKLLVITEPPSYDIENEKVITSYVENENNITTIYTIQELTDEEHNNIIKSEIQQIEDEEQTKRLERCAELNDEYAINKLQEIEDKIQVLRMKLK